MVILLVVLVLLVGLVGGGFLDFSRLNSSNTNQANLPSHPQNTVTTGVTPAHQGNTTATAQVSATTSPSQNPYGRTGTLVLNDSLSTNSNAQWQTGINNHNATCEFIGAAYQVTQPAQGFF